MEALMTTREVAEILHVNPDSMRVARCQGRGPKYLKLGHAVRYRRSDVLQYLADHEVDPER